MAKPSITATMIVKNDDQWVWYAITSVLPFIDTFLITDTGSTDETIKIIKSIDDPKIKLTIAKTKSPTELIDLRRQQLKQTKTEWLWMVDADEIYPKKTAKEIIKAVESINIEGVVVRRYDCLGDIFHYQPDEKVGGYGMFGEVSHFVLRLVRTSIPDLHIYGDYPNEGFIDKSGVPLVEHSRESFYITKNRFIHATYLKRSSIGKNLINTLHRNKFKIELGKIIPKNDLPEVLTASTPEKIPSIQTRSLLYILVAMLVTPLKYLKRKLF